MPTPNLLTKPIEAMLGEAVAAELFASHLYLHLANQMQFVGYFGAQTFFLAEAAAEREHYQRLVEFMNKRGSWARVPAIPAMTEEATTLADALQAAYDTERQLAEDYSRWLEKCTCPITRQFLLSFLEEQQNSVGEFSDLIARLERCAGDACALLIIDKELGE